MLFENELFETKLKKPANGSDNVYRFCDFDGIKSEGNDFGDIFVGCTFKNCSWYWGMFNGATLVNVKFIDCEFQGTAFSGSKFVECEFKNCEFLKDNLGAECSFDGVAWYKCRQNNCVGLEREFRDKNWNPGP